MPGVPDKLLLPPHLGFRRGLGCAPRAVAFLASRPRLLGLCLAPWLLNLLVVFPLSYFALRRYVAPWLAGFLPQGDAWWHAALSGAGSALLFLLSIIASLVLALLGALVLGAPFHDKVGEAVERERLRAFPDLLAPSTPFLRGVAHSLREAVKRVSIGLPVFVACFLLGLAPVIGVLLAGLAQITTASLFLALDAFSMPLDRRGLRMGAKLRWIRGNPRFAAGFGLPFLAIPCAVFLAPPIAAVAASLVFCDELLRRHDEGGLDAWLDSPRAPDSAGLLDGPGGGEPGRGGGGDH